MADDIAIKVEHVSKDFVLPHEKVTSVKSAFTSMFNRNHTREVQHALKDISFEIKKGEFFGIVGRNGSGKSTMLKILAGIYQPTKGKVSVRGKLVPFIELGVGFNPELTGRENVFLNGAMLGFSRKEIAAMYDDIVAFAELERFMDQKLKNYSSGMQVRLAFSVATRAKADILLIDEVLAVGDADFQRKCFNYFKQLKGSETTVIFVSHDMDAVREYCDRAVLLNESRIMDVGDTERVAKKYTKLFVTNTEIGAGLSDSRWGDGSVETKDVKVELGEGHISIKHRIVAKQANDSPIVGIRIRSVSGYNVTGTNTKIEGHRIGKLHTGEGVTISYTMPNILADGEYYIDPAILGANGIDVLDWWDEAFKFTVKRERKLPYIVDPKFAVKVDRQV